MTHTCANVRRFTPSDNRNELYRDAALTSETPTGDVVGVANGDRS